MPTAHISDVVSVRHRPLSARLTARREKAGGSGTGATEDIVTGTVDMPLTAEGEKEADKLATKAKSVDKIDTTPMTRGVDTADAVGNKAEVKPKINPAFGPWRMGNLQGKPQSEVKDIVDYYIAKEPDKPIPGGESFDTFKHRTIGEIQKQIAEWKPGQKRLNIVHSINIHITQAWLAKGAPKDRSIDVQAMLDRGPAPAGSLWRLDPKALTLSQVKSTTKDGIYFARHGKTEWDDIGKGKTNATAVA
jgi:broad specificity phosphatase PhoE